MARAFAWSRLVRDLDAHPLARTLLALALAAVVTAVGLGAQAMSLLPHPALGFRVMRLLTLTVVLYLGLTYLLGVLNFYWKGRRRTRLLARRHAWARRLPACYDLLVRTFVNRVLRNLGWREGLLLSGGIFLLLTGAHLQYMALQILLELPSPTL
ncbi:MAG: hypothetical protein HS116_03130 [Planctomycetes bacterium]|nr:hypothetical protein [Planctomycetota bacterium]